MDSAEAWLREHDLDYSLSRHAWRDLDVEGAYQTPRQEVPCGDAADVARLVELGGKPVRDYERRTCDHCERVFAPATGWQRFCSETCKRAHRPSRAAYMRAYRRLKKHAPSPLEWDLGILPNDHPFKNAG